MPSPTTKKQNQHASLVSTKETNLCPIQRPNKSELKLIKVYTHDENKPHTQKKNENETRNGEQQEL